MRPPTLAWLFGVSTVLALTVSFETGGLATSSARGTDSSEVVGAGASEGDVVAKHGAPDQIVLLGTPWSNAQTGETGPVDKCLYVYRREGASSAFGGLWTTTRRSGICYLVQNGKVLGGGNISFGQTKAFLSGAPGWFPLALAACGLGLVAAGLRATSRAGRASAALLATVAAVLFGSIVPMSLAGSLTLALALWHEALWPSSGAGETPAPTRASDSAPAAKDAAATAPPPSAAPPLAQV